jgi:hypothetical protein
MGVGKYKWGRLIGTGGSSHVVHGSTGDEVEVALKVFQPFDPSTAAALSEKIS